MKSGIYQIRNLTNEKRYIGQAKNLKQRFSIHRTYLRQENRNHNENIHLWNAWKKYGEENFVFEILEYCEIEQLDVLENVYIRSTSIELLYNIRLEEAVTSRGVKKNNTGINNPMYGKHHTDKTKKRISEANKNPSIEIREKISKTHKGKRLSKETIEKRSRSIIGTHRSDEAKKKIGDGNSKKIQQINPLDNTIIAIFDSLDTARIFFGGKSSSQLSSVLHGRGKTAYGYKWRFVDE